MSLRLPDGRLLDHREFGDPQGYPVVNNHGGLVCGLDVEPADAVARELGIRLISPDRPGVGDSTIREGRSVGDWPADVAALLDHLGITGCGAFGWSMGSDYALALAATGLASYVVVVGGMPPVNAQRLARLNLTDRVLTRLSEEQPALARMAFSAMRGLAPIAHQATGRLSQSEDEVIVASLTEFPQWMRHALTDPEGMVEEYRAMCRPWGFDLDEVTCSVDVWQGAEDDSVPAALGRELADALPDARYHEIAGAGHFLAYRRWREVLSPFAR